MSFGGDCVLIATDSSYPQAFCVAHDEKGVAQAGQGRAAGCQNEPLIGLYTLFKRAAGIAALYPVPPDPSTDPAYLAAAAVHSLIHPLPSGTAFCIGVVLIVMMTGRLVQAKGSLARAVLPFVVHLRWGWHRVERAMERGTFSLDALCDRAADWCLAHLPLEPVRLGREHREVHAIDSSTIARLRASKRLALAGKGYCHRAGRAVRANIVAALTAVVMIQGVRVGLVRRIRFGPSCQDAVARVFEALPSPPL